jgi:hypothetical protein
MSHSPDPLCGQLFMRNKNVRTTLAARFSDSDSSDGFSPATRGLGQHVPSLSQALSPLNPSIIQVLGVACRTIVVFCG